MLLGWGASVGGLIGAAAGSTPGAGDKDGWLSDLIGDAIASGQAVLVVETRTQQETSIARKVIQRLQSAKARTPTWRERDRPAGPQQVVSRRPHSMTFELQAYYSLATVAVNKLLSQAAEPAQTSQ